MRIVIDILKSQIETDNPELLKRLQIIYKFRTKGYEFTTLYRHGRWDGYTKFISNSGVFNTGLLSSILEDLKKIDCKPELEYCYEPLKLNSWKDTHPLLDLKPRDYQIECIDRAFGQHRGLIQVPTGGGKTLILAMLLEKFRDSTGVILFREKAILNQTFEFLTEADFSVGICSGDGFINKPIMLCTAQSIHKIVDSHVEQAKFLMVDEVHQFANGKLSLSIINSFPNAQFRIGLTATVPKDPIPRNNLIGAFGSIIKPRTSKELIKEGFLAKPKIQIIPITYEIGEDPLKIDKSYPEIYDEYIIHNDIRNTYINLVTIIIAQNNKKARTLILVKNLEHGRILNKLIKGSFYLKGADSLHDRYNTINDFLNSEESSVLIGTKIMQTGINIKELSHFINARGMKSEIATLQALGRILRPEQKIVYCYDFYDKIKYLSAHSYNRKKHYKSQEYEVTMIKPGLIYEN